MTTTAERTSTRPAPQGAVPRLDPRLVAASGAATISLTAVFLKLADVGPGTAVFFRCALALPVLGAVAWRERRRLGRAPRRMVCWQLLAGVFLGVDFGLWSQSILMVGAGIASVLVNVQVIMLPLLAWAIFRERVPARFLAVLPFMFAGIVLASGASGLSGGAETGDLVTGSALALLSGTAYAVYLLIVGRASPAERSGSQVFYASAAACVVGSALGTLWAPVDFTPGWPSFGWLLAIAITGQSLGWVLLGASIPRLPANVGGSLLMLQPVLAVIFSLVILGERPSNWQLTGCVVVIAAVWLVTARVRTRGRVPRSGDRAVTPRTRRPADARSGGVEGDSSADG